MIVLDESPPRPPVKLRRRLVVAAVLFSLVTVSGSLILQSWRLETARQIWPRFISAIRDDDLERLRGLIDGRSLRLNAGGSARTALVIDPSGLESRGTYYPLDHLLAVADDFQVQAVTWQDFASGRLRIGKPGSWGPGHFEVVRGRMRFALDSRNQRELRF